MQMIGSVGGFWSRKWKRIGSAGGFWSSKWKVISSVGGLTLKNTNLNIYICKPKTTNTIPSLIGQPQVAIQRMIDPYHKMKLLFMLSQHESQVRVWFPAPHPLARSPCRSRLPAPNSCVFCVFVFLWYRLWSSSALDHTSYHKKNIKKITSHTTKNTQMRPQSMSQKTITTKHKSYHKKAQTRPQIIPQKKQKQKKTTSHRTAKKKT